jgi:hypothetical protein
MNARRLFPTLTVIAGLALASGCGRHAEHALAPEAGGDVAGISSAPRAVLLGDPGDCPNTEYDGPVLTLRAPRLNYTYPTGGYFTSEDRIVDYDVPADREVMIRWAADASAGCAEHVASRWALDIVDVLDETPRIDEQTDLAHWSAWSVGRSVRLGPFEHPATHRFYVDVRDDRGYRSLGMVRLHVTPARGGPPAVGGGSTE